MYLLPCVLWVQERVVSLANIDDDTHARILCRRPEHTHIAYTACNLLAKQVEPKSDALQFDHAVLSVYACTPVAH